MVGIILSYFLGVLCLQLCSDLPPLKSVMLGNGLVLLLALCTRFKPWARLLLAFSLGFLVVFISARSIVQGWIPNEIVGTPIEVIGLVDSLPVQKGKSLQFQFKIQSVQPMSQWPKPGLVKLRWWDPPQKVGAGEQWRFVVKLKRPHGYANPGSMNLEKYFFEHQWVAEGSILAKKPFEKLGDHVWNYPLDRIRAWVRDQVAHALEGRPFVGVMMALSMGDQSFISQEHWQVFRQTGTGHLVAISGLHISLIASFFYFLTKKICYCLPSNRFSGSIKTVGYCIGWLLACLYAALSGFSIPSRRAIFMISAFILSLILKKVQHTSRGYWIALGLVLVCDPLSTLSPGFWLSFTAVGIILYSMQNRIGTKGWWLQCGRIHLILFVGLTPISLALFSSCSLVSPLANFIAIPYFSFWVVPCCLGGTLSLFFSKTLARILFSLGDYGLQGLWPVLQTLSNMPYATWDSVHQNTPLIGVAMGGLLCFLLPTGLPGRYVGVVALLPLLLSPVPAIKEGMAGITVLDVGQGLATVVETKNHVLVFDTGPQLSKHFDTGAQVVLPFLATRKKKAIDRLIISHADNDHKGGAASIIKAMPVHHIMSSDQPLADRVVDPCVAGQRWEWDGVLFEILHPTIDYQGKKNDRSCVLKVQAGTQSVLMTGDIEAKSETDLIQRVPQALASTVLIVPHHGSKTSSSEAFIAAVHPQYAIITVGYANHYGHPKPAILQRYREASIPVFDSMHHGAVSFTLNSESALKIQAYRLKYKNFWNPEID
ncbi:MAG: DNA internalization-related competence protein ComEC/Rec2 [Gammaproteobacteria bacterium]|nr:DNA internalization-related competence protein ComEC/Rec2 [Gammaproteobacteria bacterium]